MKVLFITNYPSPYRVDFFNELGKLCDLEVVFEEKPEAQSHRDPSWFHTNFDGFTARFLKPTISRNGHCVLSLELLRILRRREFDAVIFGVYSTGTQMLGIGYMQRHHLPYWLSTDGGMPGNGKGFREGLKRQLIGRAYGYFSPGVQTDRYLTFYGADSASIHHYPFTSLFERDILREPVSAEEKKAAKQELGMTGEKAVLSVGQFIPRKGMDLLIRTAPLTDPEIHYYLIGGTPPEEYIRLSRESGVEDRIHFIGFRSKDELRKYYTAGDLFVLPTREDIWGLVINEAMAFGLPVITTDRCGAGLELVREGRNGMIVKSESVPDLAEAIRQVSRWEARGAAEQSLQIISRCTFEQMAKDHMEALTAGSGEKRINNS